MLRSVRTIVRRMMPVLIMSLAVEAALAADYAARPEEVRPLLIGAQIPADISLLAMDGSAITLASLLKTGPLVVVFFRQGWCPYCDIQLSELRLIEKDLNEIGYRVVAISPDAPPSLKARVAKNDLTYELLSDNSTALIRAFGIAFDASNAKPNVAAPARGQQSVRLMPVPAVYLIGTDGKVQFHYVNPDYRTRVPKDLLLAAAKSSIRERG